MSEKHPHFENRRGDWAWAQVQYETTKLSTDDIGRAIGVTATTVISRASREGWSRDRKSTLVAHTAELALAAQESQKSMRASQREVIERVNVEMQARVLASHRTDIHKAMKLSRGMLQEIEGLDKVDDDGESTLGNRIHLLKKLGDAMKNFILLDRQAHGISGAIEDPEKPPEDNSPNADAMIDLMGKFASAIEKVTISKAKDMGNVIEMPVSSDAAS